MFESPAALDDLRTQAEAVGSLCAALDPELFAGHEIPEAFDLLVDMHKRIGGAVLRMTPRYEESRAWARNGARSPEDDIARRTGTTSGEARRRLHTSKAISKHPEVDRAVQQGELSPAQTDEVVSGASASPDDTADLIETAKRGPMKELRRKAAESRAKADRDREATRRRQRRARRVSRWTDDDGMYNLLLELPPESGAEVDAALKPLVDQEFADARAAGRLDSLEACAADVAYRLLTGRGDGGPERSASGRTQAVRPERKVIAIVDVEALNRGDVIDDETAAIDGVGPVSVSAIRAMFADAFVSVIFTDGVDVRSVVHLGREVTAHQRTALEARGYMCEIEGCGCTNHLEIDHVTGFTLTKKTVIDDLSWLCPHHHGVKTREKLRLVGPPGARRFAPLEPDDNDPPDQGDLFTTAH